jgi:hypothetical protein
MACKGRGKYRLKRETTSQTRCKHDNTDWEIECNDHYCVKGSLENTENVQAKIGNASCEMDSELRRVRKE